MSVYRGLDKDDTMVDMKVDDKGVSHHTDH
jgi:hypothetical protein